jgi:hypothetical protein
MSMLRIHDNRPLEETSLEAHVALASHRYRVLENRVFAIEEEIKSINDQIASNRKFFLKLIATAAAGLASTTVPLVIYFLNKS